MIALEYVFSKIPPFILACKALNDFSRDVVSKEFPAKQHTFRAPAGLVDAFKKELRNRNLLTEVPKKKMEDPIERVLVIGGGALGSLFSHLLARTTKVCMLSSFKEHVEAINSAGGLKIKSDTFRFEDVSPVIAVSKAEQVKDVLGGSPQLVGIILFSCCYYYIFS